MDQAKLTIHVGLRNHRLECIPFDCATGWSYDDHHSSTQKKNRKNDRNYKPTEINIFDLWIRHSISTCVIFPCISKMDASLQCSPALRRRGNQSCLPEAALRRLHKAWNRTHPRHRIGTNATRKQGKRAGSANLLGSLRDKMKNVYKCETEYCAVKKLPLTPKERSNMLQYFRPEKPDEWDSKPTQWLDSFNIEDVMNQYELAEPTFEFIGPVPIDFDSKAGMFGKCIVEELCKLDLTDISKRGKTKIGIIFNLDPHDEPGSHWVCAFVDVEGSAAYYFDSYGYEPPQEIVDFLSRMKEQGIKNVYWNDIRHQRKGSECGMYCLFVIICLLRGRKFYDICKHIVEDDTMNAFRDILFAEEKPRREAIEKALPRLCT